MSPTDHAHRQDLTARLFRDEGELARLCREKDWSQTPLGPVDSWSPTLCTVAGLVVASPAPMILLWSSQLVQIYNDSYRKVMGNKHPQGLGQPNRICWPEVWEFNAPIYAGVLERGESFTFENQRLVIERNDSPEEAYFTLTFSPVADGDGRIDGILVTVLETTETVKRRQAEDALRESEARYRESERRIAHALEIETVGVLFFDMQSTFLEANDTFLRMTGLTRDALQRGELNSERVTLSEWMPSTWRAFDELKANGRFTPYEKELLRPDGSRWWGLFAGAQLSQNECVEFVIDITAHKRAEQARYESEARFHAIADLVPDMLWQADPEGKRVWVNRRWMEYTGQSSQEAIGYGWADAIHPHERSTVLYKYRRAVETGVRFRNEHRMRRADGSYGWFLVEAVPICNDDGEILHWLGSANDIHDQRMTMDRLEDLVAERTQSLADSEERFRLLVTTSAQIIWSTDAQGCASEDSPSWRAFTGQSVEDWLTGHWRDMVHPEDVTPSEQAWQRSIGTGKPFEAEYRLWHARSGHWRWTMARGIPLCDGVGRTLGWFGTNTDIDERKRAEEEVRRMAYSLTMAEQEERRRVSQILHDDLQQLLYALQLKLRMVSNRLILDRQRTLADMVADTSGLINQAIATTRQLTVDLSPPILKTEGLGDALEWLQRQMRELHGLNVELLAQRAMPPIDEDLRVLLFQIVRELLFNVKKHAGVDRATVELKQSDTHLAIHVEDEGLGMPLQTKDTLQESGFGLSSVKERLRQVGGTLKIDSAEGHGMRVHIRVPWCPMQPDNDTDAKWPGNEGR
ncbi:PAS domain-containing sensor histidine kinase [Modicisalibacter xianhensis]|uniref:PAS domain-containing sensor histidine kinase n=1 Tax=Modicisalibacter xianhensis TaxID=442341 RepID=UPI0015A51958|nr:PAS domain S-box protein [Halomonas xianhensis]